MADVLLYMLPDGEMSDEITADDLLDLLLEGEVDENTMVISNDMEDWTELGKCMALLGLEDEDEEEEELEEEAVAAPSPRKPVLSAREQAKTMDAKSKACAVIFDQFDGDRNGHLDKAEVSMFTERIGLMLTSAEVVYVMNEMELDESRDGIVTFPEFLAWYNTDSAMKKAGSMAFKLQKAKESAYAKELGEKMSLGKAMDPEMRGIHYQLPGDEPSDEVTAKRLRQLSRSGVVKPNTLVYVSEKLDCWKPFSVVEELLPADDATPKPSAAATPTASATGGSIAPRGKGLASDVEIWRGSGTDELIANLDDKRVMFALMRFTLGSGSFARNKFVFLHVIGDSVSIVKRGRHNAKSETVKKGMGGAHMSITFNGLDEVNSDNIITQMLSYMAADTGNSSLATIKVELEEQMKRHSTPEAEGAAASQAPPTANDLGLKFTEVIKLVRSPTGPFNWLLLEPDPANPKIVNAGTGSLPEMIEFLDEEKVSYGLVRMGFGSGQWKRVKWVFVHWTGPKVKMVKRGRWNSVKSQMQDICRPYAMDITAMGKDEAGVEDVIDQIKRVIVSDGDGDADSMFSIEAFLEALKEEREMAMEAYCAPEPEAGAPEIIDFEETVAGIHDADGPFNWMLAGLVK